MRGQEGLCRARVCRRLVCRMLPLFVFALFLVLAWPAPSPVAASTLSQKQAELREAKARLAELQRSLDAIADRFAAAEVRLAQIEDAIARAESEILRSRRDLGIAQAQLSARLVGLYKQRHSPMPVYLRALFSEADLVGVIRQAMLLRRVTGQDRDMVEQVERHLERTRERESELDGKKQEQAATLADLQLVQEEMYDKFRASAADYRTLKNQVAVLREQARRAAEAEAARRAAREAARERQARVVGGAHSGAFVFPVDGPHSYSDTWGAPRSGGRTHRGTDIMAPRGTPVVACVRGVITRVNRADTGLGGRTITLRGRNGTVYFYAHLDGIVTAIGPGSQVEAGQVIGWVGDTGNSPPGAYHLHFEIRPGGGSAINPYPILRAAD